MNTNLKELANKINGKRRNRIVTDKDIALFEEVFTDHQNDETAKVIRVYPRDAFVANSYNYRAETSVIIAARDNEGKWQDPVVTKVDAHRSHGLGSRVTINNRNIS